MAWNTSGDDFLFKYGTEKHYDGVDVVSDAFWERSALFPLLSAKSVTLERRDSGSGCGDHGQIPSLVSYSPTLLKLKSCFFLHVFDIDTNKKHVSGLWISQSRRISDQGQA